MTSRHDIPFAWYWQGRPLRNQVRPVYTGPEPCCPHDSPAPAPSQTATPARAKGKEPYTHDPYCSPDRADDPSPGSEAEHEHSCSLCTAGPSSIQYHAHAYFYPSFNPNPSVHHYEYEHDYDEYVFCPCPDCQEFMSCCQCPDCQPDCRPDYPRHRRFDDRRRADFDGRYCGYQKSSHINGYSHGPGQSYSSGNGSGQSRVRRSRTPAPAPAPGTYSESVTTGRSECDEECCRYPVSIPRGNRRV